MPIYAKDKNAIGAWIVNKDCTYNVRKNSESRNAITLAALPQKAKSLDPFERVIAAFCISIYSESIDRFLEETGDMLLRDSYERAEGYFPIREAASLQKTFE